MFVPGRATPFLELMNVISIAVADIRTPDKAVPVRAGVRIGRIFEAIE